MNLLIQVWIGRSRHIYTLHDLTEAGSASSVLRSSQTVDIVLFYFESGGLPAEEAGCFEETCRGVLLLVFRVFWVLSCV